MTVQFSRSVRSIQADQLRPVVIGAICFTLLMVGWLLWFFFATISTYETSITATYQPQGYVMATFSPATFRRLQPGQPAEFMPQPAEGTASSLRVIATDLYPETGEVRFIIRVEDDEVPALQPGMTGTVRIIVEQLSPARIVLRSAGITADF